MKREYIEREVVLHIIDKYGCNNGSVLGYHSGAVDCAGAEIGQIPAADVVEVRHGKWIQPHWKNSNYCCNCSECGREAMHADYQWDKNGIYPLCPHCGAIMDKEWYENH